MEKIEAFELWVWRRLLRVPWTSERTNEWVIAQIQTDRSLLNTIRKGQLTYYGHITDNNSLEKLLMQEKIEEKRSREDLQKSGLTISRHSPREMFTN